MFSRLMKSSEPRLVPMRKRDIDRVLRIIAQTDDEDADAAEEQFNRQGLGGMDVLEVGGRVVGVTGHHIDDQTEGTAWLSWTYLDRDARGEGLGGFMVDTLLGRLAEQGVRKIFIDTSDYAEDGELIYARAHALYRSLGAAVELTFADYFDTGENKLVFGLENPQYGGGAPAPSPAAGGIDIVDLDGAAETDDAAQIVWQEGPAGMRGMEDALRRADTGNARFVMLTLPTDLSDTHAPTLRRYRFEPVGQLADYYNQGLHQHWWVRYPQD